MNAEKEQVAMGLAQREKYWSEKTADERIHTLAQELANSLVNIQQLAEKVARIEGHSHGVTGNMLIPYLDGTGVGQASLGYNHGYRYADIVWQRLGLKEPK